MNKRVRLILFGAGLLGTAIASGCSGLPTLRFNSPFGSSNWIELRDSVVVGAPSPALAVTIVNQRDVKLSVRIEIDEIAGANDCINSIPLDPGQQFRYACPQKFVAAGKRYRAEIQVYKDLGGTKVAEHIRRIVDIEKGADGGLILVGRPVK